MKVISWNICCLPNAINLYQNPKCVIDNIITTLQYFKSDFICLQEIFDRTCIKRIKETMSSYNIIYDTKGPKSAINSGLMILSKYPLVDYGFHEYKSKCGEDRLSCKGFIYGVYKYKDEHLIIYNTHLNNDTPIFNLYSNSSDVIKNQLMQLFIHIYKSSKVCNNIIIGGDFNSEPYFIGSFLNTFYATNKLHIKGFSHENTLCQEEKAIDHILYISKVKPKNPVTMIQKNYSFPLFSDHLLIIKNIELP